MMWQFQSLLAVVLTPQAINLAFALLCLAAALGLCARKVALLSGLLYIALAFC